MSREETAQFLQEDTDGYIASLSESDLYARRVKNAEEYINKSMKSACDLSEYRGRILTAAKMAGVPSHVAIAGTSGRIYEDGLPHTRQNIIFITPEIAAGSIENLVETLRHESVHIYQRENPQKMAKLLQSEGYIRIDQRKNYPLARANPDLDNWIYADKNGNILIAEYNSEHPSSIRDVKLSNPAYEHPYEKMAYLV